MVCLAQLNGTAVLEELLDTTRLMSESMYSKGYASHTGTCPAGTRRTIE